MTGLIFERCFCAVCEKSGDTSRLLAMLPVDFINKKCLEQSMLPVDLKKGLPQFSQIAQNFKYKPCMKCWLAFLEGPSLMMMGFILVSKASSRFLCWASRSSLRAAHTSSRGAVFSSSSFSLSSHTTAS